MAKVIAGGDNRDSALEDLRSALSALSISGVETNVPFLQFLIDQPQFVAGDMNIKWIEDVMPRFLET
jgi:acetyl/propionyl-CoA carboxylase alpha subunit|tara:strand:- start:41 stop:241 length:201 start_codon:yes stop_codon:yes gene_type:complete